MNFTSISGILLSAAAVIWVALIIPAWFRSSENRTHNRQLKQDAKNQTGSKKSGNFQSSDQKQARLTLVAVNRMRVAGVLNALATAAIFTIGYNSIFVPWMSFVAGSFFLIISLLLFRRATVLRNRALMRSLQNRSVSKKSFSKYLQEFESSEPQAPKGWQPIDLPEPMHKFNRNGQLDSVTLAPVTEIQTKQTEPVKSEAIDEILRRRRAI